MATEKEIYEEAWERYITETGSKNILKDAVHKAYQAGYDAGKTGGSEKPKTTTKTSGVLSSPRISDLSGKTNIGGNKSGGMFGDLNIGK